MTKATGDDQKVLRLALLGCGTVGSEIVRLLHTQGDDLAARIGARLEIAGIAVRRLDRDRSDLPVSPDLFTTDAAELVSRDDVDIVVEVVGGIEPVGTWLRTALKIGKSVVTANKALLAEDGASLQTAAAAGHSDLYYEASVAGAIPLLRPLRESLQGDRITRVVGIVNGTTNYILSAMDTDGVSFGEALEEATRLGYAEADPTADVEGFDAASKAAILASLAFHTPVTAADVYREGITGVSASDIASARVLGSTVKLLCIAERLTDESGDESVSVRVHPAMIPRKHPLAGVGGSYNAVFVEADAAGEVMFYGHGAGGAPTASAVLGDVVAVARNRLSGARAAAESSYADLRVRPMGEAITRYHVFLDVADRPGVLAAVASEFAAAGVSIRTVKQEGRGEDATLVIVTHVATDAALSSTVDRLRRLDTVRGVQSVMRVEGES